MLAAIGIYGVMAYSVAERTREIGIRMALGAGGRDLLALVARQALLVISVGLALGLAGSFALTRVIKSALVGVTATDPATYTAVSLALALVALLACFIPTRRAVAVDPTSPCAASKFLQDPLDRRQGTAQRQLSDYLCLLRALLLRVSASRR